MLALHSHRASFKPPARWRSRAYPASRREARPCAFDRPNYLASSSAPAGHRLQTLRYSAAVTASLGPADRRLGSRPQPGCPSINKHRRAQCALPYRPQVRSTGCNLQYVCATLHLGPLSSEPRSPQAHSLQLYVALLLSRSTTVARRPFRTSQHTRLPVYIT